MPRSYQVTALAAWIAAHGTSVYKEIKKPKEDRDNVKLAVGGTSIALGITSLTYTMLYY